ncbi:LuxR C-terminal-related transcriptional regulator, partial [Micromonospora chalcea]
SEATVKTHLLHAYAKLGVNDRAAAVAAAFSRGYLTPGR